MFEPECQNIDCPHCLVGKIYFDREIGYYCMLCGREFGADDIEVLIEKIVLTRHSAQKSGEGRKKTTMEIRELPARKAEEKHINRNIIRHNKSEQ